MQRRGGDAQKSKTKTQLSPVMDLVLHHPRIYFQAVSRALSGVVHALQIRGPKGGEISKLSERKRFM
jgi:hypothetical protein